MTSLYSHDGKKEAPATSIEPPWKSNFRIDPSLMSGLSFRLMSHDVGWAQLREAINDHG